MKNQYHRLALASLLALGVTHTATAHVTYSGRNFGSFTGSEAPFTISGQTVSSTFGFADATDADYGDSHRTRAFRFTLLNPALVTLDVDGVDGFLPGFSIYSGLAHVAPATLDHDTTAASQAYLATLGAGPWDGSFNALGNWAIGNDPVYNIPNDPQSGVAVPASLSYFTYIGNVADGTSANYGTAGGINGDGVADTFVSGSFYLPAGDYSVFVGGSDYSAVAPGPYTSYGITATLTVVPEPSTAALIGMPSLGFIARRRRK